MVRLKRVSSRRWDLLAALVVWVVCMALSLPSTARRVANRGDFLNGGYIQGSGFLFTSLRFGQALLEAALLTVIPVFLGYCAVMIVVDVFRGETSLRGFYDEIRLPKHRPSRWAKIALLVVFGAAFFPLTHWLSVERLSFSPEQCRPACLSCRTGMASWVFCGWFTRPANKPSQR